MDSAYDISVVTGTLDRYASLKKLVRSLQENSEVRWELIISDASRNPCYIDFGMNVSVIREEKRLGTCKGYNQAFRNAKAPYVVWVNDDCEMVPGWDTNSLAFMRRHPSVGVGSFFWKEPGDRAWRIHRAWGIPYANFGIVPRSFGDEIGWFDEDLWVYGCDTSICIRAWNAGKGVVGIPDAKIFHYRVHDEPRIRNQETQQKDLEIFNKKYFSSRNRLQDLISRFPIKQPCESFDLDDEKEIRWA